MAKTSSRSCFLLMMVLAFTGQHVVSSLELDILKIYPLNVDDLDIAEINYQPSNASSSTANIETVIILDRSGSMGDSVARIINQIIPEFLRKLNYDDSRMIHLITFDTILDYFYVSVGDFASKIITDRGMTRMQSAITKLNELFHNFDKSDVTSVRLLTISDGEIHDPIEATAEAQIVASFAKSTGILINSHAIRWESRSADTTALCSLLQLNNVQPAKLLDIPQAMSNANISTAWAELFMDDKLSMSATINQAKVIFLQFPWDIESSAKILLLPGKNIFWLKDIPENVTIDGSSVRVDYAKTLSYYELLSMHVESLDLIASNLATLKVVNSNDSQATIQRILKYFNDVETNIPPPDGSVIRKFSDILNEIATNDKVYTMDPTEKAEYLRQVQKSITDEVAQQRAIAEEEAERLRAIAEEEERQKAEVDDVTKSGSRSNHQGLRYSRELTVGFAVIYYFVNNHYFSV